ncbi:DUF6653 family protein [Halomicroarcula sp. GCM10025817]|uniref:DUF6653 family protein n=1 Tax=Haloarcula TaxID=2237 RepID=UPI0023E7DB25|nr:DUF6653 family protein [Halomicroarcula sp. SYNS111]
MTDEARAKGAVVDDVFWDPHASPRSVWALVATYPVLVLGIYRRSEALLALTGVSVVLNLLLATPPETDAPWATRVVRGEQVWLDRGIGSEPGTLGVLGVGAVAQLYTFRAALDQRPVRTALGTVASMALMLVFFARMVGLYDAHGDPKNPM